MKTKLVFFMCLLLALYLTTVKVNAEPTFGRLLMNDLQISTTEPSGDSAKVAFDGLNYLVVWSQTTNDVFLQDVYGRFINQAGVPIGEPFSIISKPAHQSQPAVAFNGQYYLVVWHDNMGSEPYDTINGRTVSPFGMPIGEERIISQASDNTRFFPAVAANGADFMVVWQENSNYGATFSDIYGRSVSLDSSGQAEPGSQTWASTRSGHQFSPAIAFGGGHYLVTWAEDATPSANEYDLMAALVNPATFTDGGVIPISTAPSWQGSRPTGIAFGSDTFLIAFDDHRHGGDYTAVYGARLTAGGVLLDSPPDSGGIPISLNAGQGGPHAPQVAFANGEWLVAWGGPAVRGARVSLTGAVLDPDGIPLSQTAVFQFEPGLASDGQRYLLTWQQGESFTKFAQLIGYNLSEKSINVNSTADPGDGVCTPAECTLREAIILANRLPGYQEIILPAGLYTLAVPGAGENDAITGDLDITDALLIQGAAADTTIIDGAMLDRVFHVQHDANVTLTRLTIQHGWAGDGGGISHQGKRLTLTDVVVTNNLVDWSAPEEGMLRGGGIFNSGQLILQNTAVTHNQAYVSEGLGGGIYSQGGHATLVGSTISYNAAAVGGGLWHTDADLIMENTAVTDNFSRFSGGGLYACGNYQGVLTAVTISDNDEGGGIYNCLARLTITNSIISNNTGLDGRAGGIESSRILVITESTISGNSSDFSGGGLRLSGNVTLNNSHILGNTAVGNGGGMDNNSQLKMVGGSLVENSANLGGGLFNSGAYPVVFENVRLIGNTAVEGGALYNLPGRNMTCTSCTISGNRADRGGGAMNRGTFKLQESFVQTNTASEDGAGLYNTGLITLRNTALDNNEASDDAIAEHQGGGLFNTGTARLNGCRIYQNRASGIVAGRGGGVSNYGLFTASNCVISDNSVHSGDIAYGGGIYNSGSATLTNNSIQGNSAVGWHNYRGGGIYNAAGAQLSLSQSSLVSNWIGGQYGGRGGGLYLQGGTAHLKNCTISSNQTNVGSSGGGVANDGGQLTLVHCTVAHNQAYLHGGLFGPATVKNSIIAFNAAASPSGVNCNMPVISLGFNLDSDGSCGLVGVGDLSGVNPLLGSLTTYGITQAYPLLTGSPAIDHVPVSRCPLATDQRGVPRPQGSACDSGAFEK